MSKDLDRYKNKEKRLAYLQKYNTKKKRDYRSTMVKFFYGITLEQFNEQTTKQNGVCALCKRAPFGRFKYLQIDHVHGQHNHNGTKRGCPECIRGLLCVNCNRSVLPILEKNEHLQSGFIKEYLNSRPFLSDDRTVR